MARLINIGFGNVVNSQKIVAVVSPDAAPVKRMVQSIKGTRSLIDATQGRKTKAVIVTSDDYLPRFWLDWRRAFGKVPTKLPHSGGLSGSLNP